VKRLAHNGLEAVKIETKRVIWAPAAGGLANPELFLAQQALVGRLLMRLEKFSCFTQHQITAYLRGRSKRHAFRHIGYQRGNPANQTHNPCLTPAERRFLQAEA
jgi:hypothetical protein